MCFHEFASNTVLKYFLRNGQCIGPNKGFKLVPLAFFKVSALWADAFYKSNCPSVRLSVRLSVHF